MTGSDFDTVIIESSVCHYIIEYPYRFTLAQVALHFGIKEEEVHRILRKYKLAFRLLKVHIAILEDVSGHPNTFTIRELAKKYNKDYGYVRRLLIREKLDSLIVRPRTPKKSVIIKLLLAKHPIAEAARLMKKDNLTPCTYQGLKEYAIRHGINYTKGRAK